MQKLMAHDSDDLAVLSALLQDSTVLIGDMAYDKEMEQFLFVAARYTKGKKAGKRQLMGVNISKVKGVQRQGFSLGDKDDVLSLLAMTADKNTINLVFSGKATIRLKCDAIKVYAADLGEGWQTVFKPKH